MQFHSNLAIAAGFNMINTYITNQNSIAVYSGSQPTAAEYATNLFDSYTWSSGNQILTTYGYTTSGFNDNTHVNTVTSSTTGVTQLSEPSTSYTINRKRAGTASWAVIFGSTGVWSHIYSGTAIDNSTLSFMIVPVSDLSGDGVIKFSTTAFDASTQYPIQSINFTPAVV